MPWLSVLACFATNSLSFLLHLTIIVKVIILKTAPGMTLCCYKISSGSPWPIIWTLNKFLIWICLHKAQSNLTTAWLSKSESNWLLLSLEGVSAIGVSPDSADQLEQEVTPFPCPTLPNYLTFLSCALGFSFIHWRLRARWTLGFLITLKE